MSVGCRTSMGLRRQGHISGGFTMRTRSRAVIAAIACLLLAAPASGEARTKHGQSGGWVASWTTSPQGVYPVGYTVGQPGPLGPAGPGNSQPLLTYAFPDAQARNQTIR